MSVQPLRREAAVALTDSNAPRLASDLQPESVRPLN